MLPTRVFCGGSVTSIQKAMQESASQSCPILSVHYHPTRVKPWSCLLEVLTWYQSRLGTQRMDAVSAAYRKELMDLHFIRPDSVHSPQHNIYHDECFIRVLNHTWAVLDAFYLKLAELLHSLMQRHPVVIQIPDIQCTDSHSREVLLRLVCKSHAAHGELMLGMPNQSQNNSFRKLKSWFGNSVLSKEQLLMWLSSVDLATECGFIDIDKAHPQKTFYSMPSVRAIRALKSNSQIDSHIAYHEPDSPSARLHSMWHWYRCYAFELVLDIGCSLTAEDMGELNPTDAACVYALMSISAAQQGELEGELYLWLGMCIDHAERALKRLPVSLLRAYLLMLLYRLSLRYQEEFYGCPDYSELLECELPDLKNEYSSYFSSWLHLYKARSLTKSANTASELPLVNGHKIKLTSEQYKNYSEATVRDRHLLSVVWRVWRQEAGLSATEHYDSDGFDSNAEYYCTAYEAKYWIERFKPQMSAVAVLCWSSVLAQIGQQQCVAQYAFEGALESAQCFYQLGALNKANREFADWRSRQDKWRTVLQVKLHSDDISEQWQVMLMATLRVGSVHTAWAILNYHKETIAKDDNSTLACWHAYQGLLFSYEGKRRKVRACFNQAIALADQCYSVSLYATISYIMGTAYERLGKIKKAIKLYENVLKHGMDMAHSKAADMFPIIVRMMVLTEYQRHHIHYILRNLSNIMSLAENWWHISELLELMRKNESDANFSVLDTQQVANLVWCASQRVDTQAVTHQFCKRLPKHLCREVIKIVQYRNNHLLSILPDAGKAAGIVHEIKKNSNLINDPMNLTAMTISR